LKYVFHFLVSISVLLFAFVGRADEPGITDTEIVIGNHSMQTGVAAVFGSFQRVMKAYFDMINEKGGVNGRKIKFLIEDNGTNPQQALQVTKKLVESEHVFAMVANQGPPHLAVYRYLREKKVPDLWVAAPGGQFTEPVDHYTFAFSPSMHVEASYFGNYVLKHWPKKKIGILAQETADSKQGVQIFTETVKGKADVVATEYVSMSAQQNSTAQVLNLKKAGAEVVFVGAALPLSAMMIKFAAEQDYHPQWVMQYYNCNSNFLDLAGKATAEGVISWQPVLFHDDVDNQAIKKHLEFIKARLPNEKPSTLTVYGQAIAETFIETLKIAGRDLTRESLISAAESLKDYKCSVCRYANSTSPNKHLLLSTISPMVMRGGKWTPLTD